jgi:DNA-binding CsgD family transcriptional regulator
MQMDEISYCSQHPYKQDGSRADSSRRTGDHSMVTTEAFSRLVAAIYDAAVTPDHWELTLREIHRAVGGTGGSLLSANRAIWSVENSSLPVAAFEEYSDHYCHIDHVLCAVERGAVGEIRTGTELVAPNRNTEFYAGWMHPNQLEDGLFVRLTGQRPTCFVVTSSNETQEFGTGERVRLLSLLVPHLQQAVRTHEKIGDLLQSRVDVADALDVIRHGVFIIGPHGRVINHNAAAQMIVQANDGVHIQSGRITARNPVADAELQFAIHVALSEDDGTIRRGQWFTCVRPSGHRPYVIQVLPFQRRESEETERQPRALVMIVDPEGEPEPDAALLRRLYRLTPTEAEVAVRVGRGSDLKQISEELSISWTTVRTHLQHVFEKTDTHRQSELVRLLSRLGA